ncbi:MAG: thermonuclease family protein [Actinobacteria bacterium]|nr:thermonuclease family protein [Actinomycetota bacterium]
MTALALALLAIALLAIALATLLPTGCPREDPPGSASATTIPVRFDRVVDGDTIIVFMPDGARERVRYTGIDTPEVAHDGIPAEPFGDAAAEANREILEGGPVGLEMDVQERDDYGRVLAYVWAGDVLVNQELIRRGLATVWTHPPNVRHVEGFTAAQREAKAAGRGVWAD